MKVTNSSETFYKIGISKDSLKRFPSKGDYLFTILGVIHTNRYDAIFIEDYLQELCSSTKYRPKIKFGGHTECFSSIPDHVLTEFL